MARVPYPGHSAVVWYPTPGTRYEAVHWVVRACCHGHSDRQGCGANRSRLEDAAFRDWFNAVLLEMNHNTELVRIVAPFGFAAAAEAAMDHRAEDRCAG